MINIMNALLLIFFSINNVFANDKNKPKQILKNVSKEDVLKHKFECSPIDKWNLIRQSSDGGFVQNVCISSSYQIYEPSYSDELAKVVFIFYDKKILEINERTNSITISVGIWSLWHEPRIKIRNSNNKKSLKLPPITKSRIYLWTPFTVLKIIKLKKMTFVGDPVIAEVDLNRGHNVNPILAKMNISVNFPSNETVISAGASWKVKFSCSFDFANFPFDRQFCPFMIKAYDLNMTIYDIEMYNQSMFAGYDLYLYQRW